MNIDRNTLFLFVMFPLFYKPIDCKNHIEMQCNKRSISAHFDNHYVFQIIYEKLPTKTGNSSQSNRKYKDLCFSIPWHCYSSFVETDCHAILRDGSQ